MRYTRYSMDVQRSGPRIYIRDLETVPSALWPRYIGALVSLSCLAVLCVAAWLTPNHAGYATHLKLGLGSCAFLQRTGIPCPGCGMTTSFAWFVRGNLAASLYVQPMGFVLAALCAMGVWVGFYIAMTGRPVYRLWAVVVDRPVLIPLLGFGLAAWGWKFLIHRFGADGW